MAISAFELEGGIDVFGGTTTGSKSVPFGDAGDPTLSVTSVLGDTNPRVEMSGDTVDTDTFGTYTVIYTATDDEGDGDVVYTETVTIAADGAKDTNFDAGNVDRTGTDVSGSAYDAIVDSGTVTAQNASVSDESGLDPYEVKHSS